MISLRPVAPDDEQFLRMLYGTIRQPELALVDWDDAQKDAFVHMQFDAQSRYYEETYVSTSFEVVVVDGEPAGRLYVARWPEEIRIVDIALLPEYRNKGIGSSLLRELLGEGEASGKPVTIHVERFNPALNLYARLGFVLAEDKGVYLLLAHQVAPA